MGAWESFKHWVTTPCCGNCCMKHGLHFVNCVATGYYPQKIERGTIVRQDCKRAGVKSRTFDRRRKAVE